MKSWMVARQAGEDTGHTSTGRPCWPAFGIINAKLWESVRPGDGRSSRFERVFCPAAFALPMAGDAVDEAGIGNKGNLC